MPTGGEGPRHSPIGRRLSGLAGAALLTVSVTLVAQPALAHPGVIPGGAAGQPPGGYLSADPISDEDDCTFGRLAHRCTP